MAVQSKVGDHDVLAAALVAVDIPKQLPQDQWPDLDSRGPQPAALVVFEEEEVVVASGEEAEEVGSVGVDFEVVTVVGTAEAVEASDTKEAVPLAEEEVGTEVVDRTDMVLLPTRQRVLEVVEDMVVGMVALLPMVR